MTDGFEDSLGLSPIEDGPPDFASREEAEAYYARIGRALSGQDARELAALRTHLLVLDSHSGWLERARSYAEDADQYDRDADALDGGPRHEDAQSHRAAADGLRECQRACEGIAGAVRS